MAEESTRLFQGSKIFTVAFFASICRKRYDTYFSSKSGKPKKGHHNFWTKLKINV